MVSLAHNELISTEHRAVDPSNPVGTNGVDKTPAKLQEPGGTLSMMHKDE